MITKEEVLRHGKDSQPKFIEELVNELGSAIFKASAKQHNNLRHPFHPLLENYLQGLRLNKFDVKMDGLSHFIISW